GVSGRFVFSFLSGLIFFGMYAPEGFSGFTWSLVYNGSYLLGEAVLTVIVLAIPAVGKLIRQIKLSVTE
ncbi:MAG: energy-coupled thiamine transporter ThiT, partial [Eubacteriaceae bacterium]